MPDHNQMLQWSPGLPFVPNGSDFGNRGVFNEQPLPSPQAQQQQIEALAKQLAQVQQQPAPAAPAPTAPPAAPPVDTTPRPSAWSMANFTDDVEKPPGADPYAGNIPYQWFQPQPAGQLQPGQGGVQQPPPPPALPPPPPGPSEGGMPSFGPGDVTPLGGAGGPTPGVQGMAAALAGQPSAEANMPDLTGRSAGGFLSPQPPAPPPAPAVPPSLPPPGPDQGATQQMAMALMGDQNGGLGQATAPGAQNDSMVGASSGLTSMSNFGTDFMNNIGTQLGTTPAPPGVPSAPSAPSAPAAPAAPSMNEPTHPNEGLMGIGPTIGTTQVGTPAAPAQATPSVPGPTQTAPAQPGPSMANVQAALAAQTTPAPAPAPAPPASVVPSLPSPTAATVSASAADYGGQSDPQGPAGAGNPGAATSPDQDQNGGLGAGSTAGMGVGMGMAATGSAEGIGGGEHSSGVGASGGGDGSGGNGSGANGVGNAGEAGSGTPGAGQSGEGGQWALGGLIPSDGDGAHEAVPNQTLHEDEAVLNPAARESLGDEFINELNALGNDTSLSEEAREEAFNDLLERMLNGDINRETTTQQDAPVEDEDAEQQPGITEGMGEGLPPPMASPIGGAGGPGGQPMGPPPMQDDPKRRLAMALMPRPTTQVRQMGAAA